MTTPNLGLTEVPSNSLQPSVPVNESLQALDALCQLVIQDELSAPPATVAGDAGKRWIIGAAPTGAWAGKAEQIALCTGANLWRYFVPSEGWRGYVLSSNTDWRYTGGSNGWLDLGV